MSGPDGAPDLAALRELLERATPGPWEWDVSPTELKALGPLEDWNLRVIGTIVQIGEADAALIVAAVNALPSLLAAAEENEERRETLEWCDKRFQWYQGEVARLERDSRVLAIIKDCADRGEPDALRVWVHARRAAEKEET